MVLKKEKTQKLYFSISEVAQLFNVNESTLRFWEKEFDIIQPRKTRNGTRYYKQEDIDNVRVVYHLVKEQGMKLAGARQKLKDNREGAIRQAELANRLQQIKEELIGLRESKRKRAPLFCWRKPNKTVPSPPKSKCNLLA